MKKASTWYLFALAILNLLLAYWTSSTTTMWEIIYREVGLNLPDSTLFMLHCHWWPYLFFGFAFVLALVSRGSHWSNGFFYHFVFGFLVIECIILFISQFLFALPFLMTTTKL
jgi:hypothetical protein